MVKLNKIYTRTGDAGDTGLVDGSRRPKYDVRLAAIGEVDEANSAIGLARLESRGEYDDMLKRLQHDLFDLGADLATPLAPPRKGMEDGVAALRIVAAQVARLEREIDALNEHIDPLNSFVLPGGSKLAAALHLARAIARRAERAACELAAKEEVNPEAVRYLNRLSDFLFVLARAANENGSRDVLWEPGVNR